MGDFMPPGRGCVESDYERQRRRFEKYRQLHAIRRQQYESFTTSAYSQQLHETQMLHKKWLESVASKKPSLVSKSAGKLQQRSEGAQLALPPGSQPTNAANTTKKFKRTANGQFKSAAAESPPLSAAPSVAGRNGPEASFAAGFDHSSSPSAGPNMSQQPAPGSGSNSMHNSLSVNINVDANLHRSQSAIKLTFSSTINGHTTHQQQQQSTAAPPGAAGGGPTTAPTSGADVGPQSRQVPMGGPTAGQFNVVDSLGNIEDFDELSDLLDKFEQEEGTDGLPNDILKILDEGVGGFDDFATDGLTHSGGLACSRESVSVPSSLPRYGPGGPVGFPAGIGSMSGVHVPGYGPLGGGTSKIPESCVGIMSTPTASTLLGDTGPAAETLKQMAAQHQNQANAMNRQYNSAGVYGDGFNPQGQFPGGAAPGTRLPRYPVQQYSSSYAMPSSMYHCDPRYEYGGMDAPMSGGMGRSVPMDHSRFPAPSGGMASQAPTSLQRLENQVQSHFAPGSGSANGTPSADIPHFRMEQSQRIDVRGSQLAVAQQQSFSMSMDGGMAPGGPSCPGPQPTYHRYPQPGAYRHPYAGPATQPSMRMMPAGYQNMPAQGVMAPGAMQHCSGSGTTAATMQRQQQQILSPDMASAGVRGPVPSNNGAPQNRGVPGHRSPAVVPSLPAKVESVSSYPSSEQVTNNASHDMKIGHLQDGAMSGIQSSQSHTTSGVKTGMVQRSPYMSAGMPAGHVLDNGYSQMGKWMPRPGVPNHAMPSGEMRNSYTGGYAGMVDPMQPNPAGQMNMMPGPMEFQNNPRWSVAVSQSQSIFVSGGGSMGPSAYHPGAMMDPGGYSRSQPPQHPGYGQNVGFYNSGSSGMMAPVMTGVDALPRTSADYLHRNSSGPINVDYDSFSGNRCPPMVPEFACIDDVFK